MLLLSRRQRCVGPVRVGVVIEILHVLQGGQLWNPGGLDALVLHESPIDALEPLRILDVFGPSAQAAQSFRDVLFQEPCDQLTSCHGHVIGELVVAHGDSFVDVVRILIVEGRVTGNHFE